MDSWPIHIGKYENGCLEGYKDVPYGLVVMLAWKVGMFSQHNGPEIPAVYRRSIRLASPLLAMPLPLPPPLWELPVGVLLCCSFPRNLLGPEWDESTWAKNPGLPEARILS